MEPHFIATDVMIIGRKTHTDKLSTIGSEATVMPRYHQTLEVKVNLTSSGNVENITSEELALRILKALEHV